MSSYYRNEYLFSEIYLEEITQVPEQAEVLASLNTLKEYRDYADTSSLQAWKDSFVHQVLYALGFNILTESENVTQLFPMGSADHPISVCYILLPDENLDNTTMGRNWAEKIIRNLREHKMQWGLLTNGEQWRIYHQDEPTPYETYLEIDLAAILTDKASKAYQIFHKFMRAENFTVREDGQCQFDVFKKESQDKIDYIEKELENALKQKEEGGQGVLSSLCVGYVEYLRQNSNPDLEDEELRRKIYHGAMLYMFRLLFLYYADERGLLSDDNHQLLTEVRQAAYEMSHSGNAPEKSYRLWQDLETIFVDIDQTYNGGLFNPHESEFTLFIEESKLLDVYLAPAVYHLAYYHEKAGEERVISYKDMSVRHLGTLYEGLLEHKLFIAKEDTEVQVTKDHIQFIPVSIGGKLISGQYIEKGQIYFGNNPSERKATGSYYTPEYIVDFIISETLGKSLEKLRGNFIKKNQGLYETFEVAIDRKEKKALQNLLEVTLNDYIKNEVLNIRVLDPAMGSGHFLVNATNILSNFISDILNEYHFIGTSNTSTTEWRRRVVENCICGVDLNPLAVELAKLSLWILAMTKDKPLSFLNHHLKCGNSLLGVNLDQIGYYPNRMNRDRSPQISYFENNIDFRNTIRKAIEKYEGITTSSSITRDDIISKKDMLDEITKLLGKYKNLCNLHINIAFDGDLDEFEYLDQLTSYDIQSPVSDNRRNYFHWELEFPEIFLSDRKNLFVVGNPPWGGDLTNQEKQYMIDKFKYVHMRTTETSNYFLAKAFSLCEQGGVIGFIIPNNFLFQHEFSKSRKYFITDSHFNKAVNLGDGVFKVTAPSCIVVLSQDEELSDDYPLSLADFREVKREELNRYLKSDEYFHATSQDILSAPDFIFPMDKISADLIQEIYQRISTKFGEVCSEVAAGIGTGGNNIFRISNKVAKINLIEEDILRPVLIGRDIHPYYVPETTGYSIIYSTKSTTPTSHPNTIRYLSPFEEQLSRKRETKKGLIPWWSLHWPRYPGLFESPKLVLRQTADTLFAAIDNIGYYCLNNVIIVRPRDPVVTKYMLALLNSKLMRWFYMNLTQEKKRVFAEVKPVNLRKLPYRVLDLSDSSDVIFLEQINNFVDKITLLSKSIYSTDDKPSKLNKYSQLADIQAEIDRLIFDVFMLSPNEIKIIESTDA